MGPVQFLLTVFSICWKCVFKETTLKTAFFPILFFKKKKKKSLIFPLQSTQHLSLDHCVPFYRPETLSNY